uniref:Uncharacterized protein n=1 Tax=viral metagenome TaxID=1070528 RepID=A0A6C0LY06_9ZZZZ
MGLGDECIVCYTETKSGLVCDNEPDDAKWDTAMRTICIKCLVKFKPHRIVLDTLGYGRLSDTCYACGCDDHFMLDVNICGHHVEKFAGM